MVLSLHIYFIIYCNTTYYKSGDLYPYRVEGKSCNYYAKVPAQLQH